MSLDFFPVSVLVYWKTGEKVPWCLATNISNRTLVLQCYKRRMWIEEMFGDLKKHGFDLESTMLQTSEHLSRLTLEPIRKIIMSLRGGCSPRRSNLIKTHICPVKRGLLRRQKTKAAARNDMVRVVLNFRTGS